MTPPPITGAAAGSFAWHVLRERHPAIVADVRDAHPYPPELARRLDGLLDEPIPPPEPSAHDRAYWEAAGAEWFGRGWTEVPFLWAESWFYRRLLGAVGFFDAGPWRGVDPFGPRKRRELGEARVAALVDRVEAEERLPLSALLGLGVWSNTADLSFELGGRAGSDERALLVDDAPVLEAWLARARPRAVTIVADNAGSELIADLLLADRLLEDHRRTVELQLKPQPYYVSDATPADALDALARLAAGGARARALAARLEDRLRSGALRLAVDPLACTPEPLRLIEALADADLAIVKGDLNYRRLVGDLEWDPTTPFEPDFPAPVVALRALKSDVIVGLEAEVVAEQDAAREGWRVDGSRGVIQAAGL